MNKKDVIDSLVVLGIVSFVCLLCAVLTEDIRSSQNEYYSNLNSSTDRNELPEGLACPTCDMVGVLPDELILSLCFLAIGIILYILFEFTLKDEKR